MIQLVTITFAKKYMGEDPTDFSPIYAQPQTQLNDFWATYELDPTQVVSITPTHITGGEWDDFRLTVTIAVNAVRAQRIRVEMGV